jgi:CheY-like chemotaxis protein
MATSDDDGSHWPAGGGEAGALVRRLATAGSPLGPSSSWPPALRTALDLALRSPVAIAVFWGEDAVALYNDAFAGLLGDNHPGLLGTPVEAGWPEAADFHQGALEAVVGRGETVTQLGATLLAYSPLVDEDGRRRGMIAIATGPSLDEQDSVGALRLTRRLAAFGQLGGSLAHEFNNLLQAIIGSLELVQTRIARGRAGEVERFVQNAIGAANRAAALTHRLLAFSRSQALLTADNDPDRRVRARRALQGEIVLVVEDDAAVRELVTEVLDDLGYLALEAADGPGAVKILESPSQIDLLVTDIGLPGMSGWRVAEEARRIRPGMKVLFMTGYADAAEGPSPDLAAGMQVMTKPFAIETLSTRIRAIIEEG